MTALVLVLTIAAAAVVFSRGALAVERYLSRPPAPVGRHRGGTDDAWSVRAAGWGR